MSKMSAGLSRRAFLGFGATAAAAAAGASLVGCSPKSREEIAAQYEAGESSGSASSASFLTAPDPITDVASTKECEILIIGSALSGLCAARAAIEAGAKNIVVVEKAETWQFRSSQFGTIGGKIQRDLGIEVDKNEAVLAVMKECGYRPNQRILNLWADHSGEAFDWFLQPMEGKYVVEAESDPYDGESLSVRKMHWPHPAEANTDENFYPVFDVCQITLPTMGPYLEATYDICVEGGVEFMFSTWARQLVRPNNEGRVQGAIVEDVEGNYTQINASKAVLLATGDYASNKEMMDYYVPWASRFSSIFPNVDAKGEKTNTGDGQCMGMWIGAKMEEGPHAPMTHHLGGPLGVDAFLLTDIYGERFMNEDVGGQPFQNQLSRLPQKTAWQIFDANWQEQIGHMDTGHGNVNWVVESGADVPSGAYGRNAYIAVNEGSPDGATPSFMSYFEGEKAAGVYADTIEELAEKMGVDVEALKATVERYNELAAAGSDDDFGKRADRMFEINTAPFYAYKLTDTVILVSMGGLQTNVDFQVLDTDDNVIEGLYAVGNAQGGRFLVDYPLPCPAISHGCAMTHGMLVGQILSKL